MEYATVEVDSASVIPPFIYNNQCTSVLLTSYIPVIIIGSAIQLLLCFTIPLVFIKLEKILLNHEILVYKSFIKGIFWTEFWLNSNADLSAEKESI